MQGPHQTPMHGEEAVQLVGLAESIVEENFGKADGFSWGGWA